ncbi:hypothetical protein ACLESD_30230 [Pyxidicoccus sp. 3LFB2]
MSPSPRFLPLVGLACALLVAGCGASDSDVGPGIPGDTPPNQTTCAVDQDCPDPAFFFCDTAVARCAPACRTREDCGAARRGQYALANCDESPLGCQCDLNQCVPGVCASDADCGSVRCSRCWSCRRWAARACWSWSRPWPSPRWSASPERSSGREW